MATERLTVKTHYLPPTNTLGARIEGILYRNGAMVSSLTADYEYADDAIGNHLSVTRKLLGSFGGVRELDRATGTTGYTFTVSVRKAN